MVNATPGAKGEDLSILLNSAYRQAFKAIHGDTAADFYSLYSHVDNVTHVDSWLCLIEGVRIHLSFRSKGFGEKMFEHAIHFTKEKGCKLEQLTRDKQRPMPWLFTRRWGVKRYMRVLS